MPEVVEMKIHKTGSPASSLKPSSGIGKRLPLFIVKDRDFAKTGPEAR